MNIIIEAKTFDLTPDVREYVEKKIGALAKFIGPRPADEGTSVELSKQRHHRHGEVFQATANCPMRGSVLHVEATGSTAFEAIDGMEAALKREIEDYRTKKRSVARRRVRKLKSLVRSIFGQRAEE